MRSDRNYDICRKCGNLVGVSQPRCGVCGSLVNDWRECGKDRCGNCHELLGDGDRYCRYCGTKVGEGKFEPFRNIMECIYGPMPVERTHVCKNCGHSWKTCLMVDVEVYCPQCGSKDVDVMERNCDSGSKGNDQPEIKIIDIE